MTPILAATASTPAPFVAPHVEFGKLSPMLIVFGAATLSVLVEAFAPRAARYRVQVTLTLLALAAAFAAVIALHNVRTGVVAQGAVAIDKTTLFLQGTILVIAFIGTLVIAERRTEGGQDAFAAQGGSVPGSQQEREAIRAGWLTTEVYPLLLFSVGGMMLFPASNDLLTMFVALEVLSLPLYLVCGLARHRRLLSQEAALKYFLLGAFSSAFFLYGAALLYGYAGSVQLQQIAVAIHGNAHGSALLYAGVALLGMGLLFKVGAAPFHMWTPDVYQGAPTPITGFMAAATKIAAFGALVRVLDVALIGSADIWRPVIEGVAIITMVVGGVLALTQRDIKRMLAYSAILNAGYIIIALAATTTAGLAAVLFYLPVYGIAIVGAFAVVTLVRDSGGEATDLSRWAGLGKTAPVPAALLSIFLLAFAGIPFTSIFVGKFAVFQAALAGGAPQLVIVAVLASALAAFFYLRVVVVMFFSDPVPDGPTIANPSIAVKTALAVAALATIAMGVAPAALLHLSNVSAVLAR
ncbi:MAG TPA: NADH-quinone oxidoreductase subunit NuoN [Actinocrinis sp.]|uniref:NADH-quinone oxidoreductase subunit NuoN n=1 Tax=Actinocrinis sp. TaxID=1920516 RepID=UPI002DDD5510|nr:NADH-quinone oxidoreductase subunit NuoN [Actinocrinis sp.]HEV2346809.1 NADH-quinone oxidoreductase subunit NuoN [Actinocrinis sp.]